MELGQLIAFERAFRERSFTRAADELGLTQPSVSARIAALEAELGGPLFERGGRRLRLTALGRTFLPYAERALAALADGREAVDKLKSGKLGHVRIAALDTLAVYMLPDPTEQFRANYPAVDLTVKIRLTREIIDLLYGGEATLGLIGAPLWDKGIRILAHFQEPIRAMVSPDHPLAQMEREQGDLSLADIYQHTIYRVSLNPRATALIAGVVEHARRGSGGAVINIPALMVIGPLVNGQGVAFLPQSYVQRHLDTGRLCFLNIHDMPQLYNEPLIVALRGRDLDAPTAAFVELFRARWQDQMVMG